eukprot:COSAG01_NODE_17587_length_1139_cov_1.018269_1_plen_270_part_00
MCGESQEVVESESGILGDEYSYQMCDCIPGFYWGDNHTVCLAYCPGDHQRYEQLDGDAFICNCDPGYGIDPGSSGADVLTDGADVACVPCGPFQEVANVQGSSPMHQNYSYQECHCIFLSHWSADHTACECDEGTNASCSGAWSNCPSDCNGVHKTYAVTRTSCAIGGGSQCEALEGESVACSVGDGDCVEAALPETTPVWPVAAATACVVLIVCIILAQRKRARSKRIGTMDSSLSLPPTEHSSNPMAFHEEPLGPPPPIPKGYGSWN